MNDSVKLTRKRTIIERLSRSSLENWLYEHIAMYRKTIGPSVPLSWERLKYFPAHMPQSEHEYYVAAIMNDAFEIGFGAADHWDCFIRRTDFHKILRWYMWIWAMKEWFGLRRWLFYKLLHRRVTQYKQEAQIERWQ